MQIFTCAYCFISNMLLPLYIRTLELVDIWQQHGEHITDVSLQTQRLTLDVVRSGRKIVAEIAFCISIWCLDVNINFR